MEAANGREAIDYLMRDAEPDVILLDLLMPVISGWDVLALLRAYLRLRRIPVIVVTGAPATVQVPYLNVVDRLQKPFRLADLLQLLCRYTDASNCPHCRPTTSTPTISTCGRRRKPIGERGRV